MAVKKKLAKASKSVAKVTAIKLKPPGKKLGSVSKALTGTQIYAAISDETGIPRNYVKAIFDSLVTSVIKRHLKNGPGICVIPGIAKIKVVRKPATKARKGRNPFTGEETTFAAKPARSVVKIRPLSALKDMV